jgi:hypothetical protein
MSNINPNNINGSFPVAGQDNDSQGFRDNFTNILNNFSFAKAELEDLASKAVLKTALNGGTLNNSLAFNEVSNLKIRSYALSSYDYTNAQSSLIAIDFRLGNFFHFTSTQTHTLALSNWPNTGYASVYVWMGISNVAHTIQLPESVSINNTDLAGYDLDTKTITFAAAGNYLFRISSYTGGDAYMIEDLTRAKATVSGNLNVSGNIIANASAFIGGNVTVTGNLFVHGNTTQVNVETLTVEDPMVDLGGGPAGAALTNNDGLDRGVYMRYYNAGVINAFMGWDNSAAEFVLGSNVSASSGVVTVNTLGNVRAGNATLANVFVGNVFATANISANNITATNNISVTNLVASSNITAGNIASGGVISIASVIAPQIDSTSANVTTLVGTNFSSGNARITGGYADNYPVGANVAAPGAFTTLISSGVTTSNGNLVAAATTPSTSTTTGALVVNGGVGIAGNAVVGANLITTGGLINSNFGEFSVINDQSFFANIAYNTFVIDTDTSLTISNLWITLPQTAINGRTIAFSVMAPITACYVDTPTPGGVKYLANTWATSGNAVVQFTYSTTSNKWLRIG